MSHAPPVTAMPREVNASRSASTKNSVGIVDGRRSNHGDAGRRDGAAQRERRGAGCPDEEQIDRRAGLARHDLVAKLEPVTGRAELDACGAGGRRRGRHACDGRVLVEVQRAHRRGVARRQVVPRPTRAQSFVVERIVVTDDAAVDALDAGAPQRLGPLEKQQARDRRPVIRSTDRRSR